MWVAELRFRIIADTDYHSAETALRRYLEALIFQGQILGREWPTALQQDEFYCRVVLPQQDALQKSYHSPRGLVAMEQLADSGLSYPAVSILGQDLMSNHTDPCHDDHQPPTSYIWYSRFAQMNSVLYCAEHFAPVPLYQANYRQGKDYEDVIRWQLQYQALDEVQMQHDSVLLSAEHELQHWHSPLNTTGYALARECANSLQVPVYYALYSGTSQDCQQEIKKCCPQCHGPWHLAQPWHGLFDFKCDRCYLVSNIAWQCQG